MATALHCLLSGYTASRHCTPLPCTLHTTVYRAYTPHRHCTSLHFTLGCTHPCYTLHITALHTDVHTLAIHCTSAHWPVLLSVHTPWAVHITVLLSVNNPWVLKGTLHCTALHCTALHCTATPSLATNTVLAPALSMPPSLEHNSSNCQQLLQPSAL